jgi:23S rRNA (uridine2552-2'-O)-methyltransferase
MHKIKDHYFHKAKSQGFAARSAFKLEEIDRKHGLLKAGMRVLDLGSAPGSWLQYAVGRVGDGGSIVGIDVQQVLVAFPPNVRVIQGDAFELGADLLAPEGLPFDVILSDMAPNTTGISSADALRSADLALRALELAQSPMAKGATLLKPGGALLVKVFDGARFLKVRAAFRECFERVSIEKPKASRSESVEVFLLGKGFRGPHPPTPSR